jgi:hypothetical protein
LLLVNGEGPVAVDFASITEAKAETGGRLTTIEK